jgi:glycosyltransferase involved in cell wall biosynthesis
MKVLHVISSIDPRAGGPTAALEGLALAQQRAGMTVTVLSTYAIDEQLQVADVLRDGGVVVELAGPTAGRFRRHHSIPSIVRDAVANSEVVHIHGLWEQVQYEAAVAAGEGRVPFIFRPCGMLDPWSLSQNRLLKRLFLELRFRRVLNRAALIHFTSEMEQDLTRALNLTAESIVVPNGIQPEEFAKLPGRGEFVERFPVLNGQRIVLFLGRVHPKKGIDLLIPAFAQAKLDKTMLVIAGPDNDGYRDRLKLLAREEGISDRVLFTGMLHGRERLQALVDADLFVLPSRQENFGIAVIEALAAKCPVVISDQVNIHEEVAAAGVGGVVRLDIAALAQEIKRWMGDDALRLSVAQKARDFVFTHYDWDEITARWGEVYNNLALAAWAS